MGHTKKIKNGAETGVKGSKEEAKKLGKRLGLSFLKNHRPSKAKKIKI